MSGPAGTAWIRGTCALQALAGYAAARILTSLRPPRPGRPLPDGGQRVTALLTGLRHSAGSEPGRFGFEHALQTGRQQYRDAAGRQLLTRRPVSVSAALALTLHYRALTAPEPPQYRDLTALHLVAQITGRPFGEMLETLTAALVADLEQYCHESNISFSQAVTASNTAYAHDLIADGALAGPGTDTRPAALLPLPAGPEQIPPVFTSQGIIITASDAEWFLVRSAARTRHWNQHWTGEGPATRDDNHDQQLLAQALAGEHQTTTADILRRLEPAIAARTSELASGPDTARQLGWIHGITGTPPWARHWEGEEALMTALGETEATSDANSPHRWDLINAYVTAYQRTRRHPAARQARTASLGFPRDPRGFLPHTDPAALIRRAARQPPPAPRRPLTGL